MLYWHGLLFLAAGKVVNWDYILVIITVRLA